MGSFALFLIVDLGSFLGIFHALTGSVCAVHTNLNNSLGQERKPDLDDTEKENGYLEA